MPGRIELIHVGLGLVGGAAIQILRAERKRWERDFGVSLVFRAFIDTSGGVACDEADGYSDRTIDRLIEARSRGIKVTAAAPEIGLKPRSAQEALDLALSTGGAANTILVDCASGDRTADLSHQAIEQGACAVFSNKAPLALPIDDRRVQALWTQTGRTGRVRYETTCGAGLPVFSTMRSLLDSGDEVVEITGTLSGTLAAIFDDVGSGAAFSDAVRSAREKGYTEPDPRDDLSGLDVARKALILARTLDLHLDLDDIQIESLVPESLRDLSVDEFMAGIWVSDEEIADRAREANATGATLAYVATVAPTDGVSVGIRPASRDTVIGSLDGPQNAIAIRTRRYDAYPLTIVGPGAGRDVTAAGVVADILDLSVSMERGST
jgi:homoserine dehydrogenase